MRVKIVNSDGVSHHTRVLDADTDQPLEGVLAVTIHPITVGGFVVADVTVRVAHLDVVADAALVAGTP